MKHIITALHKAAEASAEGMTADLRRHALRSGWDKDVVAHTHVKYEDGEFISHVDPTHSDKAFMHEFGSQSSTPTATLRKYNGNEEELVRNLETHLKGML